MRKLRFLLTVIGLSVCLFEQTAAQSPVKAGLEVSLTGSLAISENYTYCMGGLINGRGYIGNRFSMGIGFILRRFNRVGDYNAEVTYNRILNNNQYVSTDTVSPQRAFAWSYGVAFLPEIMIGKITSRFKPFIGGMMTLTYLDEMMKYPELKEYDTKDRKEVVVKRNFREGACFSIGGYFGFDVYMGKRASNALTFKVGYEKLFGKSQIVIPTVFLGFKFKSN